MSTKTEYTCDRCKKVVDKDQLSSVNIGITQGPGVRYFGQYTNHVIKGQDWCSPCLSECGLVEQKKDHPEEKLVTPLTLEEMFREIVREEIKNQ